MRAFWVITIAVLFVVFVAWQCNGASKRMEGVSSIELGEA